jgi:hypothetical protein
MRSQTESYSRKKEGVVTKISLAGKMILHGRYLIVDKEIRMRRNHGPVRL